MDKNTQELKLTPSHYAILKSIVKGNRITAEYFKDHSHGYFIVDGDKKRFLYKATIALFLDNGLIEKVAKEREGADKYEITQAGIDIANSHVSGRGGARPNTGPPKKDYIPMQVLLPKSDKEKLNKKFGRGFNEMFRSWVKSIIAE